MEAHREGPFVPVKDRAPQHTCLLYILADVEGLFLEPCVLGDLQIYEADAYTAHPYNKNGHHEHESREGHLTKIFLFVFRVLHRRIWSIEKETIRRPVYS